MQKEHRPYLGVLGLLIKDQKLLLILRKPGIYGGGNWCVPGGHAEGNESLRGAVIRELYEEIAVTVKPEDAQFVHVRHSWRDGREYASFVFLISSWQGEPVNKEPDKHEKIAWFDLNKLPDNLLTKEAIDKWIKTKEFYSEFGWEER